MSHRLTLVLTKIEEKSPENPGCPWFLAAGCSSWNQRGDDHPQTFPRLSSDTLKLVASVLDRDSKKTSEAGKSFELFFWGDYQEKDWKQVQRQQILSQMQEEIVNI